MNWDYVGTAVAGFGAFAHVGFAGMETVGWGKWFVRHVAPSWIKGLDCQVAKDHIKWAKRLAFNIGCYNLVLAIGLGWTCWAFCNLPPVGAPGRQLAMAAPLGIFFGFWLLAAAAAALLTKVYGAFFVQGALGAALFYAATRI